MLWSVKIVTGVGQNSCRLQGTQLVTFELTGEETDWMVSMVQRKCGICFYLHFARLQKQCHYLQVITFKIICWLLSCSCRVADTGAAWLLLVKVNLRAVLYPLPLILNGWNAGRDFAFFWLFRQKGWESRFLGTQFIRHIRDGWILMTLFNWQPRTTVLWCSHKIIIIIIIIIIIVVVVVVHYSLKNTIILTTAIITK